jgi:hypothetical protein
MRNNLASSAPAQGCRVSDESALRLVIAYDDLAAYRQALRALAHLIPKARTGGANISPRLWRFEALAEPDNQSLAVADGAAAAIVMISMSGDGHLPEAVQAWLPDCLGRQADPLSAVVVLVGGPGGSPSLDSGAYQFVRQVARTCGWEFVALATPAVPAVHRLDLCAAS